MLNQLELQENTLRGFMVSVWVRIPLLRLCTYVFFLGLTFAFLLFLVHLIDTTTLQTNLQESLRILSQEGDYPDAINGMGFTQLDNFTDKLIYEFSALQLHASAMEAVIAPDYFRYWHGYSVYVTPLLACFEITQIRVICFVFFAVFVIYSCYIFYENFGLLASIILFISLNFPLNPLVRPWCLQFMSAPVAIFIGFICLNYLRKKHSSLIPWAFFIQGSIFAFIDFLTTPMECLGYLLIFQYLLINKETLNNQIRVLLLSIIFWCVGYFGTWSFKWFLSILYLGPEAMDTIVSQIIYRLNGQRGEIDGLALGLLSVAKNWKFYWLHSKGMSIVVAFLASIGILKLLWQNRKRYVLWLIPILISLIPIVWFFVIANHSYVHAFFTHRSLGVSFCAVLVAWMVCQKRVLLK